MEMINRLTADALDSQTFVNKIREIEQLSREDMEKALMEGAVSGTVYARSGENRQQRRARERVERKAAARSAKARS